MLVVVFIRGKCKYECFGAFEIVLDCMRLLPVHLGFSFRAETRLNYTISTNDTVLRDVLEFVKIRAPKLRNKMFERVNCKDFFTHFNFFIF